MKKIPNDVIVEVIKKTGEAYLSIVDILKRENPQEGSQLKEIATLVCECEKACKTLLDKIEHKEEGK